MRRARISERCTCFSGIWTDSRERAHNVGVSWKVRAPGSAALLVGSDSHAIQPQRLSNSRPNADVTRGSTVPTEKQFIGQAT